MQYFFVESCFSLDANSNVCPVRLCSRYRSLSLYTNVPSTSHRTDNINSQSLARSLACSFALALFLFTSGKQLAAFTSFNHYLLSHSHSIQLESIYTLFLFSIQHSQCGSAISPHLRFQFVHSQAHSAMIPLESQISCIIYITFSDMYVCKRSHYTQVSASFHIKHDIPLYKYKIHSQIRER